MNVGQTLRKAVTAFNAGKLAQTEALCRKILKAKRDQPDALHLIGVVALRRGDGQTAIELIERAIRQNPDSAAYGTNLGEAYRTVGDFDAAVSAFSRALAVDPDRAEAHCGMGSTLLALDRLDDSLASFEKAIRANPGLAQAHFNKGNAHVQRAETDEAVAAYRRAVAIDPSFADAHFNLGNMLSATGGHVAATEAYEAALHAAPDFAKAHCGLGDALRKLGRLEAARQAFERALEIDSGDAGAHVQLGTIAKLRGQLGAAREELDRAIEIDPTNALAHAEKAHVDLLQDRVEDAIAGYRHAIGIEPRFAWAQMGLSGALARDDRLSDANEAAHDAVRSRRTFDWPFIGQRPVGRILVLKGVENGYFKIGPDDKLALAEAGMNRIDEHFDRSRFLQTSFYVDGIEPGAEGGVLPDCDVIFNAISDVDAMPLSHEIAKRIVRASSVPVINPPDIVEQTQRHTNFKALCDLEGAVFPKTIYVTEAPKSEDEADRLLRDAGMELPVLVRRAGTHMSNSLAKIDDIQRLCRYFSDDPTGRFYVTEFIDYAGKRGAYIAMRMQFMDGAGFPTRLLINDDWLIYRHRQVKDLMEANPWMLEEAKRFTSDPEGYLGTDAYRTLLSIHERLPLDYFGVDFAQLPDGRILIFEANATMFLPIAARDAQGAFAYRKPPLEAADRALQALIEKKIAKDA